MNALDLTSPERFQEWCSSHVNVHQQTRKKVLYDSNGHVIACRVLFRAKTDESNARKTYTRLYFLRFWAMWYRAAVLGKGDIPFLGDDIEDQDISAVVESFKKLTPERFNSNYFNYLFYGAFGHGTMFFCL